MMVVAGSSERRTEELWVLGGWWCVWWGIRYHRSGYAGSCAVCWVAGGALLCVATAGATDVVRTAKEQEQLASGVRP